MLVVNRVESERKCFVEIDIQVQACLSYIPAASYIAWAKMGAFQVQPLSADGGYLTRVTTTAAFL
eukprot:752485-Hanusia_phi.AAC.2